MFTSLRLWWRIALIALLVCRGLFLVRFIFPLVAEAKRADIKLRWSRKLLGHLGVRYEDKTIALPTGCLVVSNHISWIDIFVLNAYFPCQFVCKEEIRHWPVIGRLVSGVGTVFIARQSRSAAAKTMKDLCARLEQPERIVFFPEGTTTNGSFLLPFSTALFQAASQTPAPVAVFGLRYLDHTGQRSVAAAYDGDISFWESITALCRSPWTHAQVLHLETLEAAQERRFYAERSEQLIAETLQLMVTPSTAPPAAST